MLGRIPAARQAIIDRIARIARRARPKGMPVAQCFPVSRAGLDLVCESFDPARQAAYAGTVAQVLTKPGIYRKQFRAKRGE